MSSTTSPARSAPSWEVRHGRVVGTGTQALEEPGGGKERLAAAVMSGGLDAGEIVGPIAGGLAAEALGLETMFHVMPLTFLAMSAVCSRLPARG